jgi:hypothetical protein
VAGCCEYDNEHLGSIKGGKLLDYQSDCQLLEKAFCTTELISLALVKELIRGSGNFATQSIIWRRTPQCFPVRK